MISVLDDPDSSGVAIVPSERGTVAELAQRWECSITRVRELLPAIGAKQVGKVRTKARPAVVWEVPL